VRRALLREPAAALRVGGLDDDGVEPGDADDLIGATEAARFADLGEEMTGDDGADA
jgi:hypothetical protein